MVGRHGLPCAGQGGADGEVAIGLRNMGYLISGANLQSVLMKRSEDL
jgi:hypothetical protein